MTQQVFFINQLSTILVHFENDVSTGNIRMNRFIFNKMDNKMLIQNCVFISQ